MARTADVGWRFFRPDGRELAPARPQLGATDLRAVQAELHLTPDSLLPTWDGTPVDYEWGAQALRHLAAAP